MICKLRDRYMPGIRQFKPYPVVLTLVDDSHIYFLKIHKKQSVLYTIITIPYNTIKHLVNVEYSCNKNFFALHKILQSLSKI